MARHLELAPGEVLLGKYRIVRKVGEGGMAIVYQAVSEGAAGFTRNVVIKAIRPELASSSDMVRQFVQEASVGAALDHPNIVHVFDLGEHEGQLLMVLEYVAGKDLGALARRVRRARRVLGPEMVAFIAVDVCNALEAAHGHLSHDGVPSPVVHRDVSPQNILVSHEGVVKLADFGLARALGAARQTRYGVIKGKLSYMSPEQSRGLEVDGRSDLFSLGTVMWETLSGRRLFLAEDQIETIRRVRAAAVPSLGTVAPHVAPELAAVVHRALQPDREDRFPGATEMRKALLTYLRNARRIDGSALASVLAAYFPTPERRPALAETALSYDDESDLHGGDDERTQVDASPPEMTPAGPAAAHTMLMFDGALAAALKETTPVAEPAPPGAPEPPGPAPAAPAPGSPTAEGGPLGAATRLGMPAFEPGLVARTGAQGAAGGEAPALRAVARASAGLVPPPAAPPASDLGDGRTRLGIPMLAPGLAARPGSPEPEPASPTRLGPPARVHRGQPFSPAPSLGAKPTPLPPPAGAPLGPAVAPGLSAPAERRPRPAPGGEAQGSRPLIFSLIVGIPLGIAVGALVFWLLTR